MFVERHLADYVTGLSRFAWVEQDDIGAWVSHPGGLKIIHVITKSFGLPSEALELTWYSLSEIASLLPESVLRILRDATAKPSPSGSSGLMIAMGPGFCAELVLLRWH
nr:hypothetical protein [Mycobacterium uberis]